jgi:hypothetical protein
VRRFAQKNLACSICLIAVVLIIHLSTPEVKAMTSILDQVSDLLKLPLADFLRFGEEQQIQLQKKLGSIARAGASTNKDLQILALGAPSELSLDEHPKVPVLVASSRTGLRDWQVNFRTNLNLFVRNLRSGELRVIQPFVYTERGAQELLSGKGAPPKESEATSRMSGVNLVELEGLTSGVHVVSALAHDIRSNTVIINAKGASAAVRDEAKAVPAYIQHTLNRSADQPTRIELRNTASKSAPGLLGVAIQVRASDGVIKAAGGQNAWQSNLILIKIDETPIIIPIYVPVQEVTASDGKPAFNAVFAIDLGKTKFVNNISDVGLAYQVYLDTGHTLIGPHPLRN